LFLRGWGCRLVLFVVGVFVFWFFFGLCVGGEQRPKTASGIKSAVVRVGGLFKIGLITQQWSPPNQKVGGSGTSPPKKGSKKRKGNLRLKVVGGGGGGGVGAGKKTQ